ncbi:hypothetical protein HOLleu_18553 [Holothuria leucospilota]|uniref:EF-hand domain-containing protein n=1 Tax=Holothuria leucospilota TaxID=206669 RepID=A0A9Q1C3Z3_HOLLE|nr:hypothetical protein HOLleu_18553 [Holothuria leucospilota]
MATKRETADIIDIDGDEIISDAEFVNWINAWFDYKKTPTILGMTGNIPVKTFIDVINSYPSGSGAAAFADQDKNGEISASEFDRWFSMLPSDTDKAETVFAFTGNIPVETFATYLKKNMPTDNVAVAYANQNGDSEIDAGEFNKWYDGVKGYAYQNLKAAMGGDDGVITKAEFITLLNIIEV